jgi:hypothetical protein
LKKRRELSRSNSTSDLNRLSPPKIKRRRTSDYTIGTFDYSNSDSSTRFDFTKKKSENKTEMLKFTRRASLNLGSDIHSFSTVKTYWKSLDENMNSKSKMDFEKEDKFCIDDRSKLFINNKKMETIIETHNSYSSEFIDLKDKSNEKSQSNSDSMPVSGENNELLDKDVDVREEEIDGTLDDFETNESSIIKVESSDESQTTIEILPASPDLSQEIDTHQEKERIEEERIYSDDAVPMHFDYELEVGNGAVDPLEVPIPSTETETNKRLSSTESKQTPDTSIQMQLGKFY